MLGYRFLFEFVLEAVYDTMKVKQLVQRKQRLR